MLRLSEGTVIGNVSDVRTQWQSGLHRALVSSKLLHCGVQHLYACLRVVLPSVASYLSSQWTDVKCAILHTQVGGAAAMDPSGAQYSGHLPILQLPNGVLQHGVTRWLSLSDCATLSIASKELKAVVEVALHSRKRWHSSNRQEVSHVKASRLFKFLAKHSPNLTHITCCFASDRLYGGSLLENSLSSLASATTHLTHLSLLNVDVTDAVLQALAKHCLQLQHVAIGRTENNAFGNFVSDEGLAALAGGCQGLSSLSLFRCYGCSDAGLRELVARGRRLTTLVLHSCPQVTTAGLVPFLEANTSLQELDILLPEGSSGGAAVTFETCFALAANCANLLVLRLSEELVAGSVLDDSCLTLVARGCSKLQELELVQIEVSDTFLAALASHCTSLTSLRLEQTYVGDEGVHRVLAACPHLQNLRVAGCSTHSWMLPAEFMFAGLSVTGFSRMSQQAANNPGFGGKLTELDLSCLALESLEVSEAAATAAAAGGGGSLSSSSGGFLPPIGSSALLPTHAAAAAAVSASTAAAVTTSSSMAWATSETAIDLQSAPAVAAAAVSQLILPISWCNRVTSLSLDWLKVDGDSLQVPLELTLSHCSSLSRLSLVGYQGNVDRLLSSMAGPAAGGVRHLILQHSRITDSGLAAAASMFSKLSSLHLSYCRNIGDQGLSHLLGMRGLEELDLFNTPCVSAGAVASLARQLTSLERLYIGHNTSALHRSPATATAMGYINGGCSGGRYSSGNSSVWSAVNEAVAARPGRHLAVLCCNPSQESRFEKRTLTALMSKSGGGVYS